MKKGLSVDPSLRSRSSTAQEGIGTSEQHGIIRLERKGKEFDRDTKSARFNGNVGHARVKTRHWVSVEYIYNVFYMHMKQGRQVNP